ncbi:MAG: 3-phosphoshikimate 1-carboxyvinyltransferase [Clostridiales bacterium]|nr:3-phosphoshikimate 1-carboxyvinyltransferase [Clostridiales bacterium]
MNVLKIQKSKLSGTVTMPPSKSVAHRALICSFLAGGGSVKPLINSNDMKATMGVIDALKNDSKTLDCIESGSTLRFMIPVAASLSKNVTFVGQGSLLSRTIGEYLDLLPKHGVTVESNGYLPMTISGTLKNGNYEVNGDVSSQYVTGLLLALANLEGDSAVVLKTLLQSKPYVDMTVGVMSDFGVNVAETDFGYLIHGSQKFNPIDYTVEGDWSHAAFFLVGGAIGGGITVSGLKMNTFQGDKAILDVLKRFGAEFDINDSGITVHKSKLKGIEINAENIPDLVPIIAVLGAFADGRTVITSAERLRFKESDRIKSVAENLKAIGVGVTETADGMIIDGNCNMHAAKLNGYNDHRIVMAFSIAASFLDGETTISDAYSINKSYPDFFKDYNMLGGKADVI